jgi:hypothetical protein
MQKPGSVEGRVPEVHPRKNPQTKLPEDSECLSSAEGPKFFAPLMLAEA